MKDKAKMEGECILGHKVWIAHTNFPEEIGVARIFINKALLVVRNPCDAIFSHFNKLVTRSLDHKLTGEEMEKLSDCWDQFLRQESIVWREFYDYWMLEPQVPTFVVRHEDLIKSPKKVLTEVFKFLLNTKSLKGTLIESLIEDEASVDLDTKKTKEKYVQNTPGYSFDMFNSDQMSYIKAHAGCVIKRLGYGYNFPGDKDQIAETDFFENDEYFEESTQYENDTIVKNKTEHEVKMRYDFQTLNNNQLSLVKSRSYQEKVENHDYDEFELNMEAEHLRTREGNDYSTKKIIREYKDIIKSEILFRDTKYTE